MVFEQERQHFFRYQKLSEAASNFSTPTRMTAHVSERSTARLPQLGDVIWVLARQGDAEPAKCRFAYSFVVDEVPDASAVERRFFGSRGLWLNDSPLVSELPWFKEFFKSMGNGGTSIRPIGADWLEHLRKLFQPAIQEADSVTALESAAEEQEWPEDIIRYGAIKARRGQTEFRTRLLDAYERRCCVSGCRVEALLEAAHIRPHALEPNYDTRNGLLLRADLHTLFDLHLLSVDEYGRIHLSARVPDRQYQELVKNARRINYPAKSDDRPSEHDLRARMALFKRDA